ILEPVARDGPRRHLLMPSLIYVPHRDRERAPPLAVLSDCHVIHIPSFPSPSLRTKQQPFTSEAYDDEREGEGRGWR
ncbi:hypothetical protein GW17_00060308, partial [Ensete ventricosum]